MLIFFLIASIYLVRDTYLAWFKPKEYIQVLRKHYLFQTSIFPFLRRQGYPDESLALRLNKVTLPIMAVMFIILFLSMAVQVYTKRCNVDRKMPAEKTAHPTHRMCKVGNAKGRVL